MIASRLASIAFALPLCVLAAAVKIEMLPRATVETDQVRLGDVARIEGDAARVKSLASITVARAPRAGFESRVALEEARRAVRMAVPRVDIAWSGEASVRVERAGFLIDGERLQAAAAQYLKAQLASRAREVEVSVVSSAHEIRVPRGEVVLRPRGAPERGVGPKRQVVWVDVEVDGVHQRSVSVALAVQALQNVPHLRQARAAGHVLEEADLEMRLVDATLIPGAAATDDLRVDGMRLRRAAIAGQPLQRADIEMRPQVARGEVVTLRTRTPAVVVEAQVVALDDGNRGDRVWVKRGQAGDALRVEVVSAGTVELGER